MALQLKNQNNVTIGTPVVQPNDDLFWFKRPRFVLTLLHVTLFLNAFELAFFIWVTVQFGLNSCYHEHTAIIITRVVLAVVVQVLCSYITLPLYALVTQMGSQFKSKALEEQVGKILKQWHAEIKEKRRNQEQTFLSPRTSLSQEWSPRKSPRGLSSHHQSTYMPTHESIQLSNIGEIMEERDEALKEEDAGLSWDHSRAVFLESPTLRR